MDSEVKDLWLKALRSGEYRQTQGKLCGDNKHCCLGVLTDLYVKSEVGKRNGARWEEKKGYDYKYLEFTSDKMLLNDDGVGRNYHEDCVLPDEVQEWAGLEDSDPTLINELSDGCNVPYSCCGLNDSGSTFDEIADYIENVL